VAVRETNEHETVVNTPAQRAYSGWMTDVLIYTVVLNLFVEHVDAIVIDSFTISIFTAILLKGLLGLVLRLEDRVHAFFSRQSATRPQL